MTTNITLEEFDAEIENAKFQTKKHKYIAVVQHWHVSDVIDLIAIKTYAECFGGTDGQSRIIAYVDANGEATVSDYGKKMRATIQLTEGAA